MAKLPKPPDTFLQFIAKFPKLGEAWNLVRDAGADGPIDEKTARLIKLAIAIGYQREGAVHSATRKALASGATEAELEQILALAASTIGFPSTVAAFSWMQDELPPPANS